MSFDPYLFFSGDCAVAFERYHEIFGGELQVMKNSEAPEGQGMPGAGPDTVMHASLRVGGGLLMGSDDPSGTGGPKVGSAVAYTAPDAGQAKHVFDALAEGGEVTMPLAETFWSTAFGMCTDRFGVPWMVDTKGEPPTA